MRAMIIEEASAVCMATEHLFYFINLNVTQLIFVKKKIACPVTVVEEDISDGDTRDKFVFGNYG